jgi:hypothetical protein
MNDRIKCIVHACWLVWGVGSPRRPLTAVCAHLELSIEQDSLPSLEHLDATLSPVSPQE